MRGFPAGNELKSISAGYAPTRRFYERCGYALEAILRDYYAAGDDKAVFVRRI